MTKWNVRYKKLRSAMPVKLRTGLHTRVYACLYSIYNFINRVHSHKPEVTLGGRISMS